MTEKSRILEILRLLDERYPLAVKCYLNYAEPYQLLIATILSAQCTDDRVNAVTGGLFDKYPSIAAFAAANREEMAEDIKSAGLNRGKAKNIIESLKIIGEAYGGELPSDIEELVKLPGVGRKTANVIRGHVFNIPSIVVDTHVKRISNRLGLSAYGDPVKIEFELMEKLPEGNWIRYNTQVIAHGRSICTAISPRCQNCFLYDLCVWKDKKLR
jgi:endonuclease-3